MFFYVWHFIFYERNYIIYSLDDDFYKIELQNIF
jgi:hypothetical protein